MSVGTWFHRDGYSQGNERRLLDCYLETGARSLADQLEGSFVLAFGDGRTRDLVLITDVVGNCHCFMRPTSYGLVVSCSSLLLASLEDFHLDDVALSEFLATGVIYEDRSVYQEVRKIGPATVMRIAAGTGSIATERYWSPGSARAESLSGRDATRALWNTLCGAAAKIGNTFPHSLCDLTGGYDSRAEVAAFVATRVPIATIVSGPPDSSDVAVSRGLARMAGLPHTYLEPPSEMSFERVQGALPLTDGEYDIVEYARIQYIHEEMSKQFDASINGSFGEVARGYWWELLFPRLGACEPLDARMLAAKRYVAKPFDHTIFRGLNQSDLVTHFAGIVERSNQVIQQAPNTLQMDSAYLLMRMQRWQGRIASSTNRVWPCLSPFMFRSVLEVMLSARARDRQRSLLIRSMLAEFQPSWADFPLEHGYPAAPATWKNFHRFAPLIGYYAGRIRARIPGRIARPSSSAMGPGPVPARMQLWSQGQVRAALDISSMRLASALDADGLSQFLARSRQRRFPHGEQWARVLTLELALRLLEACGVRCLA